MHLYSILNNKDPWHAYIQIRTPLLWFTWKMEEAVRNPWTWVLSISHSFSHVIQGSNPLWLFYRPLILCFCISQFANCWSNECSCYSKLLETCIAECRYEIGSPTHNVRKPGLVSCVSLKGTCPNYRVQRNCHMMHACGPGMQVHQNSLVTILWWNYISTSEVNASTDLK